MDSTPYAETYGIQTKWGVPKPAYRAFQILSSMPRSGLPVRVAAAGAREAPRHPLRAGPAANATATAGTVDCIAAVDSSAGGGTFSLHALLVNFNANIYDQENSSTGLPIAHESVTVTFEGLPSGARVSPTATLQILDTAHGWAKQTWVAAGSPRYPNATQIAAEMAASQLGSQQLPVVVESPTTVTVQLPTMEPYATAHLVLQYETAVLS